MPGIAVLSGFSEMPAKNTEKEVTATVTVASADSIGVELKIPKVPNELASNFRPNPFALSQS